MTFKCLFPEEQQQQEEEQISSLLQEKEEIRRQLRQREAEVKTFFSFYEVVSVKGSKCEIQNNTHCQCTE